MSFATSGAMNSYTNIVNSALGGKYQINLVQIDGSQEYRVRLTTINSDAKISSEQKAFYKQLNKVITLLAPGIGKVDQAIEFKNGDAETKARVATEVTGEVALAFFGEKLLKGVGEHVEKWGGPLDYSNLKEPNTVADGRKTTPAQRSRILEANKKANGGGIKSDINGQALDPPEQSKKGVKANMNQAEIDHIKERSKGGSNSNSNQRVVSKQQNLDRNKSN